MASKPLLSVRRRGVPAERVDATAATPRPASGSPGTSGPATARVPDHVGATPDRIAGHLRPRRSPRMVAAGVMLACLGGLGASMAYQQASHSNQVVVVQHTVMRGQTVTAQDLGVATIGPAPGVRTVPGDQIQALIGRQALVDLPGGSLVGPDAVGTATLPVGAAQLGLKLPAGRIPNQSLPAGTPVQLVEVSSDKQASGSLVVDATVVSAPEKLADGSSRVLDVAIPQNLAQRVADLAARDLLVVVRKAGA